MRESHPRRNALKLRELGERLVELGLGLEFAGVQAALAGKARRFEERGEMPPPVVRRALAPGLLPHEGEKRFQPLPQHRRAFDQRNQLAQGHARRRLLAQPRVEPCALRKFQLGADEERRAYQLARLLEGNLAESELKEGKRGACKRVIGERRTQRNIEGQHPAFGIGQVVRRMHDAREHAHHFLATLS